jgi:FkbM family methyltransferase
MRRKFYHLFFGKKRFQKFFEKLYIFAISGMYYGHGGDFEASGEIWVLHFLKQQLKDKRNLVFFDIGAHFGEYSKRIVQIFGRADIAVHAFEPSPNTFKKLAESVKGMATIITNNFGLSDQAENAVLYQAHADTWASVYNRKIDYLGKQVMYEEQIRLSTIDEYCRSNNIEHIHLVKLDIEGHEFKALKGGVSAIQNGRIDFIQFEFGEASIDSRTFIQDFYYLLHEQYRLYRIVRDGLVELEPYKQTYELFYTTNYLAIRRGAGYTYEGSIA